MYRNHFILLLVILTIIFNCLLATSFIWSPYNLYFERPEFSKTPFETRDLLSKAATITNFVILFGLTVVMIIKYWKTKKYFLPTLLFSLLTLVIMLQLDTYYPDAEKEYTKNGYQYLEQEWYSDNESIFKRFKSDKPLKAYNGNYKAVIWQLESISENKSNLKQKKHTEN